MSSSAFRGALERVLTTPGALGVALQPIVDLRRGVVVGHELLARPSAPPDAPPDRWFRVATALGQGPRLAAAVLDLGLALLPELPANSFLTLNVEPDHLVAPEVTAALAAVDRLDRVVLEVTEHNVIEDPGALDAALAPLRARGARVAIDDAGAGYAGLALLLELRPDLVKLDRGLISKLDQDPAKRVLVRALGELCDSIDAWVLAEGIETTLELDELVTLEVPLGQGYLLGRPQPDFTADIPVSLVARIADRLARQSHGELAVAVAREVPLLDGRLAATHAMPLAVVVDELGRPTALLVDGTRRPSPLLAKPSEPLADLARRMTARGSPRWSEPAVLTDGRGVAVGVAEVDRVLDRLARTVTHAD